VEVNSDLLIIENVMHHEKVVHGHEGDRVDKALSIKETLKVVVLFFLLNVTLKLVDIKVSLGVPLLVLKVLHVGNDIFTSELSFHVISSCFERSIVYNGKNISV